MSEENDPYQEMEEQYQRARERCPDGTKHELEEIGNPDSSEKTYKCSKCGYTDVY